MLILTRRVGETIRINDDISVTVLGVKGMQVRLGIDAPGRLNQLAKECGITLRLRAVAEGGGAIHG